MDPILDEMRGMLIFARVVEGGSFSAAAKRLGVSRAVVSYQVKRLEERLGIRLLNRSTRRLSLTPAGQNYYASCQRIAAEAESAHVQVQNLREEAVGKVVLACPVNLGMRWVVPVVELFRKRYPAVELDIRFSEEVVNLIEEGVDIALRAGPLTNSELTAIKIASVTRHICASPEYLEQHGWPKQPRQLGEHQWVVYKRGSNKLLVKLNDVAETIVMTGSLATNNAGARLKFVKAGLGIGVLPHYDCAEALRSGELIELLPNYTLPSLELFAVFPKGATQAKATQLMTQLLKQHFPD